MKIVYSDKHAQHDPQTFFVRGVKQRSAEQPERAERLLARPRARAMRSCRPRPRRGARRDRAHARVHRLPQDHRARLGEAAEHLGRGRAQHPSGALSRDLAEGARRPRRLAPGRPRLPDRAAHLGGRGRRQQIGGDGHRPGARRAREAYALCRPPGHHAYADMAGGFCFLNNSAIAAERLRQKHQRVAVLDVDVHHGNGTQGIFFERDDVLTVSIHADPENYYPYFWGHAHETGVGKGHGFNLNLPLPLGSGDAPWLAAGDKALARIRDFAPTALVVALGPRRQRKRSAAGPEGDRRGLPRHGGEDRRPRPADRAGAGRRLSQRRSRTQPGAVPGRLREGSLIAGGAASSGAS